MRFKFSLILSVLYFCFFLNSAFSATELAEDDDRLMHPDLFDNSLNTNFNENELNSKYWIENARNILKEKLKEKRNTKKAKNIILFLGDGMSVHTLTATRAYLGDVSKQLSFEKFPYIGLSKTYCVDAQVADSACSATAYLTGVKNNIDMVGVTGQVKVGECDEEIVKKNMVESIAKWAQDAGKSTGIVTTTRVTHATPSGTYANIAHRDWECDAYIDKKCKGKKITDIADQLINGDVGKNFKVIMGGGRSMFLGENMRGEEGDRGLRQDNRNLIKEWLNNKNNDNKAKYIWNRKELLSLDTKKIDYVLGLFSPDHLPYNGDRIRTFSAEGDPSLSEMTRKALEILKKDSSGFFLLVEGGRIDHAHHYVKARKALEETTEFEKTVEIANQMFNNEDEDTLIVVTSDHSHTMTINGYPDRTSNILGLSDTKDDNKKEYSTLSYANGESFYSLFPKSDTEKRDIGRDDFNDAEYDYPSHVPLTKETHGGEDVAIFAKGPQAHLFVGNYEQSYIPMLMAKIAEIGPHNFKNKI